MCRSVSGLALVASLLIAAGSAYAAEGLSHFIKRFNYEVYLMGSINLITEAIKHEVKSFVFTSSIAVYGANQLPMKENMIPEPEDPYGISKYAIELELKADKRMFDLNSVIFRPHNVYGERQNIGDKYRNVIGIFMNKALSGEPFPIFGDGKQKRAFTHIADVAPCIASSAFTPEAQNKIFNVGSDKPYTVNKLARVVAKAMGVPLEVEYLPARNEVKYAYSDHKHLKKVFNYKPTVELEEGVARMAAWAKSIGPQKQYIFENIDIEKNLPPSWRT